MLGVMLSSFGRTRLLMRASQNGLARHREKLWQKFQAVLAATPALRAYVGKDLSQIPAVTPAAIRADYSQWNSLGLSHDQLHAAARDNEAGGRGEVLPSVSCGYSTGTSGQRGIFVASAAERADYIGQSLARLLPLRALLSRPRIALVLRASNDLYKDVGKSGRISFAHFPLTLDDAALVSGLAAFRPTILIAPTHKLVVLARSGLALGLEHCFCGSEPMGAGERTAMAAALGVRPDPIYQATEGFLAGACRFGRLHLNDHSLVIEKEAVAGTNGWQPIVTDLRRTSQPILRVRLDDFIEDDDSGRCPCGYAGRMIAPVMGRVSELWRYGDSVFTPREITNAIEDCVPPLDEWQVTGRAQSVTMALPNDWNMTRKMHAADAFAKILALPVPVFLSPTSPSLPAPKRARILWQGGQGDV